MNPQASHSFSTPIIPPYSEYLRNFFNSFSFISYILSFFSKIKDYILDKDTIIYDLL